MSNRVVATRPAASTGLVVKEGDTWSQVKLALESTAIDNRVKAGSRGFVYRVKGNDTQFLEVDLQPGEAVRAEVGSLFWMEENIEFETTTGGGLMSGFKRWMSGESFFISDFVNRADAQRTVAFAPSHPTKLVPVALPEHGGAVVAQKGAFLCGAPDTVIDMWFTKSFTAGFFGGQGGFVLQSVSGDGLVFLKGGGGMVMRELAPGETLRLTGGSLVAFEETVEFEVEMVKGGKNILFGGEGLFLVKLSGPGKIWLQGMPFSRLAEAVGARTGGGGGMGVPLGMGMGGAGGGGGGGEAGESGENSDGDGGDGGGGGGNDIPTLEGGGGGEKESSGGGGWFDALFGDDDK